ncbi:MAG TPA: hypothetical protein VMS77_10040 [Conexivisphaerales archaeon]|nr:hypothetical protein [Conexivisphaerales archaeon]
MTGLYDDIKSPVTKEEGERRLDLFLRHIKAEGSTFSERAPSFARRAKEDSQWATYVISEYMRLQKESAERKEISEATVPNYFKPIKLFCEMNDISLNWKKIGRRSTKSKSRSSCCQKPLSTRGCLGQTGDPGIKPA